MDSTRNVFKGFKQVTSQEYNQTSSGNRKGYIWFVGDKNNQGEYELCEIYLGNRLYANTNQILEGLFSQLVTIDGDDVNT